MVTPPCDTPVVTQLRLISTPEGRPAGAAAKPQIRVPRSRRVRTSRHLAPTPVRLDARTREIGRSGIAEARRRLAEIHAAAEHGTALVRAS
jgi:hypothetical protein